MIYFCYSIVIVVCPVFIALIEIKNQISEAVLLPVEVDSLVNSDDAMEFVGTFPEYVQALQQTAYGELMGCEE